MREGLLVDHWGQLKFVLRGLVGAAAALLFVLSAATNISTWIYPAIARHTNSFIWIHFAAMAVALLYSLSFRQASKSENQKLTANLPAWAQAVSTALFAYMFLTMGFFILSSVFGGAHKNPGGEALEAAGNLPLEKTAKWYSIDDLRGLRAFSVFWMLFSFQIAADLFYRNFSTRFGRYDAVVKKL